MLKNVVVVLLLATSMAAQFGMYITEKPKISLEQALPIARRAAQAQVPDLNRFVLHSVKPRHLLGDDKGPCWDFLWQELPFKTRMRGVVVRVYMKDGTTRVEQFTE